MRLVYSMYSIIASSSICDHGISEAMLLYESVCLSLTRPGVQSFFIILVQAENHSFVHNIVYNTKQKENERKIERARSKARKFVIHLFNSQKIAYLILHVAPWRVQTYIHTCLRAGFAAKERHHNLLQAERIPTQKAHYHSKKKHCAL